MIGFLMRDKNGINQIYVVSSDGSDEDPDVAKRPKQISHLEEEAKNLRWHPSDKMLFCISGGNVLVINTEMGKDFGHMAWLTNDDLLRDELVVSPDGKKLAYVIRRPTKGENGQIAKDVEGKDFRQIFVLALNTQKLQKY
jgi:hypothetical protein